MRNLLSVSSDAKTVKGEQLGFLTGILYLAPADLSGYQVCALALLAKCKDPCLNSAGRGAFNTVQAARIAKTKRFFEDRDAFMQDLIFSIESLAKKAKRLGLTPLVRLNGTSDITWEHIYVGGLNIFERFPDINFYDYTKHPGRKNIPKNYDLTFSYSGAVSFIPIVKKAALNTSLSRMAAVFDKVENIPETFQGLPVVPGDNSDVRHLDPINSVVALYAKGRARHDKTGFVVRALS
jgi:hypothetical protein